MADRKDSKSADPDDNTIDASAGASALDSTFNGPPEPAGRIASPWEGQSRYKCIRDLGFHRQRWSSGRSSRHWICANKKITNNLF